MIHSPSMAGSEHLVPQDDSRPLESAQISTVDALLALVLRRHASDAGLAERDLHPDLLDLTFLHLRIQGLLVSFDL